MLVSHNIGCICFKGIFILKSHIKHTIYIYIYTYIYIYIYIFVCVRLNNTRGNCRCIFSLTYSLTPRRKVLLERLTGFQLVKKFPTFYGTRRFITAFTSARISGYKVQQLDLNSEEMCSFVFHLCRVSNSTRMSV